MATLVALSATAAAQSGGPPTTTTPPPSTTAPPTSPSPPTAPPTSAAGPADPSGGAPGPGTPVPGDGATTATTIVDSDQPTTTVDPLIDEAPGESAPESEETVPPPTGAYGDQGAFEPSPVLWSSVRAAETKLAEAEGRLHDAIDRARAARRRRKELEQVRRDLRTEDQVALDELDEAERVLQERSIAAFVGADIEALALIGRLRAVDHDRNLDGWIRSRLLAVALEADDHAIDEYRRLRSELDRSVTTTASAMRRTERQLDQAEVDAEVAMIDRERAAEEYEAFAAGSAIYIGGARFPIAWPYDTPLIDSFGFPRMPGTPDEHWHEGIDLFAPAGTPLLAAERGVILRVSTGRLGGLTFWLRGESGADWYYAHLASYAPGLAAGQVVEAGQVLGFVGNTGNAVGTPPHLHMEIHPGGGEPINPYPLLKVLADREQADRAGQPQG
ncbi:MAG: M23 family metallopeptidase [Actinomycetota bacterium]